MKRFLSILTMLCLVCSFATLFSFSAAAAKPEIWDGKRATKFAGGSGTPEDPWQISNGKELAYMQYLFCNVVLKDWLPYEETYGGDYFVLTNDIYMNDVSNFDNWGLKDKAPKNQWTKSIGRNGYALGSGTFDGKGHTIYGLYQVFTDDLGGGFITATGQKAVVKNVNLDKCLMYLTGRSGMLGGFDGGATVSNCHVNGKIVCYQKGGRSVGGICGELTRGAILENCTFRGSIEGEARLVGGIVGSIGAGGSVEDANINSYVRNCINYATINMNSTEVGGICGTLGNARCYGTIENCLNVGSVKGKSAVGGLVGVIGISLNPEAQNDGRKPETKIQNCVNVGKVTAEEGAGALIGSTAKPEDTKQTVKNCYADGSVCSVPEVGNDAYGLMKTGELKKRTSSQMSGKGAVAAMQLDSGLWQDVDGYYPVIKAIHAAGRTIIGKIGADTPNNSGSGNTSGKPNNSGNETPGKPNSSGGTSGDASVTDPENSDGDSDLDIPPDTSGVDDNLPDNDSSLSGDVEPAGRGGSFVWLWIVLGVAVLGAGGVCVWYFVIRKKNMDEVIDK